MDTLHIIGASRRHACKAGIGTVIPSRPSVQIVALLTGLALLLLSLGADAAQTYAQQTISSFSPSSGASGTVVTLLGKGFTGSTQA